MAFFKRMFLFLLLNVAIVATLSLVLRVLNIQPYLHRNGIDYSQLAAFCLVWGMGGSLISLALSRMMAKWLMGVQVIDRSATTDASLRQLVNLVERLARQANLPMPEVGVYSSPELNAFATGPSQSMALVAVSSGLLQRMSQSELEGVLAHEISHIANGDMVTMTLLQGVVNAFVMFLSRALAYVLAQNMRGRNERDASPWVAVLAQFVLEVVFMMVGAMLVAWFSRHREFRADAGGAKLAGRHNMVAALARLRANFDLRDPSPAAPAVQTLQISGHPSGLMALFASHPPLETRIARLQGAPLAA